MRHGTWWVAMGALSGAVAVSCGGDDDAGGGGGAGGSSGAAGAAGSAGSGGAPTFCAGPSSMPYDPLSGVADSFPDDFYTVEDASTPTGLRVHVVPGENFQLPPSGGPFASVFADLSTLDGFGTTAAVAILLSAPLDPASMPPAVNGSPSPTDALVLARVDGATAELVPFEWEAVAESATDAATSLIVSPLVALEPKARYVAALTTRVRDASAGCFAPSATMQELLSGTATDARLTRLGADVGDAVGKLTALGVVTRPDELTGVLSFTTQHTVEDSMTIAGAIRQKTYPYVAAGCTDPGGDYLICEGSFEADDFRKDGRAVDDADPTAQSTYTLNTTTYLPKTGTAPFPTIIYGHGLTGERQQGERLAELAAPEGYAVIAIDAVKHGQHPDGGGVLPFFGLSLNLSNPLDALALRDNWRQSTYDKLQLVEVLRPGVDVDGDAQPDIGIDRLIYMGVSLGGIMSAEFVALTPELSAVVPVVPGARVVDIIRDGATFSVVINLLRGTATDGQIARFFPIVQTVVDRGDSGAYCRHMVQQRLPGFDASRPQVLMQMVLDDDTVPNSTNLFFARTLGAPLLGDELVPVGLGDHVTTFPVSANLDASHTWGTFQYDLVYAGQGPETEAATHSNVADNPIAIRQTLRFLETSGSGPAEILDPYRDLGVKP